MKLVQSANGGRLMLLAPAESYIPEAFAGAEYNPSYHANLLAGLQRLRGKAYFEDGAIDRSVIEPDGRYIQAADERAWHLVTLNGRGDVSGCARYVPHSGRLRFFETGVSRSALSQSRDWGRSFRSAVECEIDRACRLGIDYVEVGGWALSPELRCTGEALRIALGMFSLARLLGGCIGITTATLRHCSSSILRRIGGETLVTNGIEIPSYFDPRYGCQMEILRFDSSRPNTRFEPWIEELKRHLSAVPVIYGAVSLNLQDHSAHSSVMTAA